MMMSVLVVRITFRLIEDGERRKGVAVKSDGARLIMWLLFQQVC